MLRSQDSISLMVCLGLFATAGAGLSLSPSRAGSEFQVNTYTPQRQGDPAVAAATGGAFVVVWQSYTQDGSGDGVFAQRFDSSGVPLGVELQVNTQFTSTQSTPDLAMQLAGDFVIVWRSNLQDGPESGVFARRFDSSGTAQGAEFQVNTFTIGFQLSPEVASDAGGDFVVVWVSNAPEYGVRAQRFDSTGGKQGAELQVNAYTVGTQKFPSVGMDADGDFVIAWASQNQDGYSYGVFARRFTSAGTGVGGEFQVNSYTPIIQSNPSVAVDADGDFVIAWRSYPQDGSNSGIFARRFSASGTALATEFQVNTHTLLNQRDPATVIEADGDFVVAWESFGQDDAASYGIFARKFDSMGNALGVEFQVNTNTVNGQSAVAIAAAADGDFVFAWQGENQDGDDLGVFAQRFTSVAVLDVDGDGAVQALTDGLLVLRFAFQFTGATLVNGAVGVGCARCDSASILAYLAGLGLQLDIDGNGEINPLTDGLLVLRFSFGFTGATLVNGVVGQGCSRCDAPAIAGYLQTLI